jgi:hypothetical protein
LLCGLAFYLVFESIFVLASLLCGLAFSIVFESIFVIASLLLGTVLAVAPRLLDGVEE